MKPGLFRGDSGLSVALGFVAFLGAVHVLIRTVIYSPLFKEDTILYKRPLAGDTRAYVSFAETLAAGDGFEGGLRWWPPFFSIVLAFFRLFGVEPFDAGRYFNIIGFGLIILVAGHWLHRYLRFRLVVVGITATIMVSYPLARVSSYVLAETLFILVVLLALVNIESFLSGRTAKSGFLLSIAFSAVAPLTRWIGVTVIFTGILLILTSRIPERLRWKYAAFYGAASSLPLALWLTRNQIVHGSPVGDRGEWTEGQTLWHSVDQTGDVLFLWTFAREEPGWLKVCLWAALVLIVLQSAMFLARRRNPVAALREIRRRRGEGSEELKARPAFPFAAFAIVYSLTLIRIAPYTTGAVGNGNRYLSPVYVPMAVAAAVWLDRFLLATYRDSGISAWKNPDGWGIRYNRASGPMTATKWILIGLIFSIILAINVRNIELYIDVLTTYDLARFMSDDP